MPESPDEKRPLVVTPCIKKVMTLCFALTGDGKHDEAGCDRLIKVGFAVREVVVRQISVSGAANASSLSLIKTTMPLKNSDGILGTFNGLADSVSTPGTTLMGTGEVIDGLHQFSFLDSFSGVSTSTVSVCLTLEFHA